MIGLMMSGAKMKAGERMRNSKTTDQPINFPLRDILDCPKICLVSKDMLEFVTCSHTG